MQHPEHTRTHYLIQNDKKYAKNPIFDSINVILMIKFLSEKYDNILFDTIQFIITSKPKFPMNWVKKIFCCIRTRLGVKQMTIHQSEFRYYDNFILKFDVTLIQTEASSASNHPASCTN